jgi:hypothetical protein
VLAAQTPGTGPVERTAQRAAAQIRSHAAISEATGKARHSAARAARVDMPCVHGWHQAVNRERHAVGATALAEGVAPVGIPRPRAARLDENEFEQECVFNLGQMGNDVGDLAAQMGEVFTAWQPATAHLATLFLQDVVTAMQVWYMASAVVCCSYKWPWSAKDATVFTPAAVDPAAAETGEREESEEGHGRETPAKARGTRQPAKARGTRGRSGWSTPSSVTRNKWPSRFKVVSSERSSSGDGGAQVSVRGPTEPTATAAGCGEGGRIHEVNGSQGEPQ